MTDPTHHRNHDRPAELSKLARQADHRELAALVDGPWAPAWYWRDELETMQARSQRMGYPDEHPAAQLRHYHPTDHTVAHPNDPDVTGRAWHYRPPDTTPAAPAPGAVPVQRTPSPPQHPLYLKAELVPTAAPRRNSARGEQ